MRTSNTPINSIQRRPKLSNLEQLKNALESHKVLYEIGSIAYILENERNEILAVIRKEDYDSHADPDIPSTAFFNNYLNPKLFKQDDPMEIPLLPLLIPITNPRSSPPRRLELLY